MAKKGIVHNIGLFLGQRVQDTAMVAVDRESNYIYTWNRELSKIDRKYYLTGLKTFPVNRGLISIAKELIEMLNKLPHRWVLYISGNAGGEAFKEVFEEMYKHKLTNGEIYSMHIQTDTETYEDTGKKVKVGLPYLIELLSLTLEKKELKFNESISQRLEFQDLLSQLEGYQREITKAGKAKYESDGNDSLLLAAAFANFGAQKLIRETFSCRIDLF